MYIQLTLEKHVFELHGSTYTCIFSIVSSTVLHNPWLVESADADTEEPWIQRNQGYRGTNYTEVDF